MKLDIFTTDRNLLANTENVHRKLSIGSAKYLDSQIRAVEHKCGVFLFKQEDACAWGCRLGTSRRHYEKQYVEMSEQ